MTGRWRYPCSVSIGKKMRATILDPDGREAFTVEVSRETYGEERAVLNRLVEMLNAAEGKADAEQR